uniref:Uncharacterized protein n=1 Tax=Eutreptiella gymnastica TaxID=73025 RepID=A0A6U8KPZ5_9EUGL
MVQHHVFKLFKLLAFCKIGQFLSTFSQVHIIKNFLATWYGGHIMRAKSPFILNMYISSPANKELAKGWAANRNSEHEWCGPFSKLVVFIIGQSGGIHFCTATE